MQREIFHELVNIPKGCDSQSWPNLKAGASFGSYMGVGAQGPMPSSAASPGSKQRAGSEVEPLGHRPTPKWDASATVAQFVPVHKLMVYLNNFQFCYFSGRACNVNYREIVLLASLNIWWSSSKKICRSEIFFARNISANFIPIDIWLFSPHFSSWIVCLWKNTSVLF